MTDTINDATETVLIMNPKSGSADHAGAVRDRVTPRGYTLLETQREHHAIQLAKQAAEEDVEEIVAVGGDGTLNEVVKGIHSAGALSEVTVGVVPTGTGNDFASNIGIMGIEHAFDVLESGERRTIDLGMADDAPFVNSCIAGITAQASHETSTELKSRIGVLAYVVTTLQLATEFSGLELTASVVEGEESKTVWQGSATLVLVGNGRRFSMAGMEQANLEDGLLDVTIIEDAASFDLATDRLAERLFKNETDNVERIRASSIELSVDSEESTVFSLDGEIHELESVELTSHPGVLEMYVGEGYEQNPRVD
jgi:YegS/Rv2252/BmrU family lipid kinase